MAEQGLSINRISKSMGVPVGSVSKVIREKYPNRKERKILPVKNIIAKYKAGQSLEDLAVEYNTTSNTIKSRLIDNDIEIRSISEIQRLHFFDEDFFENITTPNQAYWLGFIFADGCVLNNRLDVQISLSYDDRPHLIKFLNDINYQGPGGVKDYIGTGYGVNFKYSRVLLRSSKMNADLISSGCIPNKSLDLGPPIGLKKNLEIDFIRGVVDGDGYISLKGLPSIEIVGAYDLLLWISKVLGFSSPRPHKSIWRIRASGKQSLSAMNLLYQNSTVFLDRKYERAMNNVK